MMPVRSPSASSVSIACIVLAAGGAPSAAARADAAPAKEAETISTLSGEWTCEEWTRPAPQGKQRLRIKQDGDRVHLEWDATSLNPSGIDEGTFDGLRLVVPESRILGQAYYALLLRERSTLMFSTKVTKGRKEVFRIFRKCDLLVAAPPESPPVDPFHLPPSSGRSEAECAAFLEAAGEAVPSLAGKWSCQTSSEGASHEGPPLSVEQTGKQIHLEWLTSVGSKTVPVSTDAVIEGGGLTLPQWQKKSPGYSALILDDGTRLLFRWRYKGKPPETVRECRLETPGALGAPDPRMRHLLEAVAACPDHVPALVAAAAEIERQREGAGDDWPERALSLYERAVALAPANATTHWGAASLSEYVGHYARAASHYEWIADAPETADVAPARRSEAKIHLLTCRFLARLGSGKGRAPAAAAVPPAPTTPPSKPAVGTGPRWQPLKDLAAALSLSALEGLGADGRSVQVVLGLISDWERAPMEMKVQARNRMLAGMVSALAGVLVKRELDGKVAALLTQNGHGGLPELPAPGYAGAMEAEFNALEPEEGRRFEIGPNLAIVEKSDYPDLSGTWTCTMSDTWKARIEQKGSRVTFQRITGDQVFPVLEGTLAGEILSFPDRIDTPTPVATVRVMDQRCQVSNSGSRLSCSYVFGWEYTIPAHAGMPDPSGTRGTRRLSYSCIKDSPVRE